MGGDRLGELGTYWVKIFPRLLAYGNFKPIKLTGYSVCAFFSLNL